MILRSISSFLLIFALCAVAAAASVDFVPRQLVLKFEQPVDIRLQNGKYLTGDTDFDIAAASFDIVKMENPLTRARNYPNKDKIALITLSPQENLDRVIARFKQLSGIAWVSKHTAHSLEYVPNDSAFASQYYLEQIKAPEAWDLMSPGEPVIIGFVDSGVDYTHPDLAPNMWINPGEDRPPLGILDASDYNGVDDDANGFIDDLIGWDFVDTPELPFGDDYLTQDNDPMDTFGHGTAVAGLASAVVNNSIGIAGAASNSKIMALRCASSGYLTDMAAAEAILYAVDPSPDDPLMSGAKVINLSFGSNELSPLIQDVVNFAELQGVILVASAGNEGSTAPHYPSGYDYTISVGGIDSNDQLLGISNYGVSLDIVAPALQMLSTVPDNGYDYFYGGTGTSFAAPLVSACAAMVWGNNPGLNVEQVRSIVLSSADDLYSPGWDTLSGMGRLNMEKALQIDQPLIAVIMSPMNGNAYTIDTLQIKGTACGYSMNVYELFWGYGNNPTEWFPIPGFSQKQIVREPMGIMIFDSTFADTMYTVKLTVTDHFGFALENSVTFSHYNNPSEITVPEIMPAVSGNEYAYLFSYKTNQFCTSVLRFTGANPMKDIPFAYPDTSHLYSVKQSDLLSGIYNFQVIAANGGGALSFSDIFADTIVLNQPPFNASYFGFKHANVLPDGYILPKSADFDSDGHAEVLLNKYVNQSYDSLLLYEYQNGAFISTGGYFGDCIPQDEGDSDEDGLLEIMTRAYGKTWIYEQSAPGQIPNNLIFYDSTDCYGSKLLNLTENDGHGEVFLRTDSSYQLYRHNSDDAFTLLSELQPEGLGSLGIPHTEWGDFDNDGLCDVAFGDGSGHLFVYSLNSSYQFAEIFRDTLAFPDTKDFLSAGDFDGDGIPELAAGCHSSVEFSEVGQNTAYWLFYIYKAIDGKLARVDSLRFVGASDPGVFNAGVSIGDVDNDNKAEILLSLYPNLYLLENTGGNYDLTWNYSPCRSNQVLTADLDNNGLPELTFNRGDGFVSLEAPAGNSLPDPPLNFSVVPLNNSSVNLSWNPVPDIAFYQISRGSSPDSLQDIYPVGASAVSSTNSGLTANQTYYYAISTFANGQYSPYSEIVAVIPNNRPEMLTQNFYLNDPFILRLESGPMPEDAENPSNYFVTGNMGNPSSAILEGGNNFVKLYFTKPFNAGYTYQITMNPIHDLQNTQLNILGPYNITAPNYPQNLPYLSKAFIDLNDLILEFSQDMNRDSALFIDKYSITYGQTGQIDIAAVYPDSFNHKLIKLVVSPQTPIGFLGHIYVVSASDLYSVSGLPLDPQHSQLTITGSAHELGDVYTYPNPYRAGANIDGENCIMFANVTESVDIRIFNTYGELVRKLHSDNSFGGVKWYLDNDKGEQVSSGVYIYRVEGDGDKFTGKLAIMR